MVVYEPNEAGADALVARLDEALAQPIRIDDARVIDGRASIGYADTLTTGRNANVLIAAADAAMYEVKRAHHRANPMGSSPGEPQPPAASA